MFIYPYPFYSNFYRAVNPISHMRILNSSINSPAVDVYLNNRLFFRNLSFKSFSDYMPFPAGSYNITIFPVGTTINPIFNRTLFIPPEKILTTAIIGNYPNVNILPIEDVIIPKIPNKALVKFINLSEDSPNLNVSLQNGRTLFRDIPFKGMSVYEPLDPGVYKIYITDAASNKMLLNVPNIRLTPNRFYSIYAVGSSTQSPSMQVLIPLDGNSYLRI
ncbi:DUF4397 domain-containing protein [Clostridium sp. LBM24168]